MKALAALGLALAVLPASAQSRVQTAHAETAPALKCLLDHLHDECAEIFTGSAKRPATYWLWWTPDKAFDLGALKSSEYAGTQSANAFTTRFLNGRTADIYDVKFVHQEKTFYIVPPGPDGKIRYLLIRNGGPNDEREDLFVAGPG